MKILKNCCCFVLLFLTSQILEAKPPIPSPVLGIGTFSQKGQWGEQISLGVKFDAMTSTHIKYQHQEFGERLMLAMDRQVPLSKELSLLGSMGTTVWLEDKKDKDVTFEPILGIGIQYDWSPYIATTASYQYVFADDTKELLEPIIEIGFTFKLFNEDINTGVSFSGGEDNLPLELALKKPQLAQSCNIGVFLGSFYFSHDKSSVDIQNEDIAMLQLDKEYELTVIGHADATGDTEYNQKLGLKRAEFVSQELKRFGAEGSQINVCSQGEKGAKQNNTSAEDWMFRRVDVYLNE